MIKLELWCVVMRRCTDSKTRGIIIKSGLTEQQAREHAKARQSDTHNVWAMERSEY